MAVQPGGGRGDGRPGRGSYGCRGACGPVAVLGASTGTLGSARSQVQLRSILAICASVVLAELEVMLPVAHEALDDDLRPRDDRPARRVERLVTRLAEATGQARLAR